MNDASTPFVLQARDSRGVATLTLNRPASFNALSEGMLGALEQALGEIAADDSIRAVVIAAAGKAFCAGHDLKEMRAAPSLGYYRQLFERCGAMMLSIQKLPVPVIARVHGIATAAGCQLVAVCDLAVASSEARFAVSGVNVGLFCATPSVTLSRNLGRKDNLYSSLDFRLAKAFPYGKYKVEPAIDVFNVLNSKNFHRPEVTNLIFNFDGTVQSGVGEPRQMQLGLRVIW